MLHGREAESASLAALVDGARLGRAGALVLHGEPGVGKTALLEDLVGRAGDLTLLRTQGVESESPLAFGALHRLLRPLLARRGTLPDPQARALGVALGQEAGGGVDPFVVGLATLSLMTEAAEERPVLAVVDDAHWLDSASADALLFTARRVQADRVALVFSVRDGTPQAFGHDGVPTVIVGPLGAAAARSLLRERTDGAIQAEVADRLAEQTGGNPLALVELSGALSQPQLAGEQSLPVHLPITAELERVFLDRARRLPESAQAYLLVCAADASGQLHTIHRAAANLGLGGDAAPQAEVSGLVGSDGDTVHVRHPLVRSAIYQAATARQRRAVHRALASALAGHDPDREAWHAAAAAEGPDEALADALDTVGARGELRGGFAAASHAYERAAELSADGGRRAPRWFAAARNAWDAAESTRAGALARLARAETEDGVLRADIDRLRGRIEVNLGSGPVAHRIYVAAAGAAVTDAPDRALDLAVAATGLAAYGGDSGLALAPEVLRLAAREAEGTPRAALGRLLQCMTAASQGSWADALDRFHDALGTDLAQHSPDLLAHLGQAAVHLGDDTAAERCFDEMVTVGREQGAGMRVLYALPRLAFPLFLTGQWSRAASAVEKARSLSLSTSQPRLSATPLAWLELLAAVRGEPTPSDQRDELDGLVDGQGLGILADLTADLRRWARGVWATNEGSAADAHHHLGQMQTPALVRMACLDRIGAAVRAGDDAQARAWVAELEPFAAATGWPWAHGAVAHGTALASAGAEAPQLFESSLAHYSRSGRRFDLARTHLAYGEHLRRSLQRVDARAHLRSALEIFEDLRARPYATRAANELRASGETARKRDVSTQLALTPMERQVAQLVTRGLSNKEVAAQCWISPRTVAFHLRNCFAKTGVTSRGELAQLDLA